ncbi:hypothetical protein KKF34_16865 [Myxococcota bacterium]|nr:hypothetical protein [Myxococcota bacterium]MBU1381984.1 hypothetical protein [Myxococcota bacterium]MBU1498551.1 hypothetical protein [Myxococcota bacterium]
MGNWKIAGFITVIALSTMLFPNCKCTVTRRCEISCRKGKGNIECPEDKKCRCICKANGHPECQCTNKLKRRRR